MPSDDRFGRGLILDDAAPVVMDSSIPDYGRWLPCERVSMWQIALLHHRSTLLPAAIYARLSTMSFVPIRPGIFLFSVLVIAMLAYLAELPLGRYKRSA